MYITHAVSESKLRRTTYFMAWVYNTLHLTPHDNGKMKILFCFLHKHIDVEAGDSNYKHSILEKLNIFKMPE